MTDTLREELVAMIYSDSEIWRVRNDAIKECITRLDEHCARQRESFEEWYGGNHDSASGIAEQLKQARQEAWQAAIATITGKE